MNSNADSGDVLRVGCFNNEIHGQAFTHMLSFCTHPKSKGFGWVSESISVFVRVMDIACE
jgi:hypothetical protein